MQLFGILYEYTVSTESHSTGLNHVGMKTCKIVSVFALDLMIWYCFRWSHCFSFLKTSQVIGNGSFGVVYQARLIDSQEMVAIKKVLQDKRFKVSPSFGNVLFL